MNWVAGITSGVLKLERTSAEPCSSAIVEGPGRGGRFNDGSASDKHRTLVSRTLSEKESVVLGDSATLMRRVSTEIFTENSVLKIDAKVDRI